MYVQLTTETKMVAENGRAVDMDSDLREENANA
jgi:hypothetical protein